MDTPKEYIEEYKRNTPQGISHRASPCTRYLRETQEEMWDKLNYYEQQAIMFTIEEAWSYGFREGKSTGDTNGNNARH